MGQVIQVNGDYTIKARRAGGANVTFDTGNQLGSVTVTGDLHVLGTSHTFNTQVISDVVLVLNRGETGAGVTLGKSGIEIDRGSLDRAEWLFDDSVDAWTISTKDTNNVYSYTNSNLLVRRIFTDAATDNGDLTLISTGTGVVKVAGTTDYEKRAIEYLNLDSVAISTISRSSSTNLITVKTVNTHNVLQGSRVDIHCATFPALFNVKDVLVVNIDVLNKTFQYASNGADFPETPVSGYVIKNSLVWDSGSSYIPTDDYIPNMRAVSDYSRSLVTAAIDNFSTSHIEDQDSRITVYDSTTATDGGTSYIRADIDGSEKLKLDTTGLLTISAYDIQIQHGTDTVKEHIGTQSNNGYLFGSTTEIGIFSDTTSGGVVLSKVSNSQYLTLNAGTGLTSEIDFWTAGVKRMEVDSTGKVFINTVSGNSQVNIASYNEFGGTGYAGLITLTNKKSGSALPSKHVKISAAGDFEIGNNANTSSILKITDAGVATLINGLNVVDFISTPSTSFDLINTTATTVNFAGAGTTINVGSGTTGTTTNLKNATVKVGNGTTSAITTPATTFNLVNDTATTVNFAGAGSSIVIGASSGTLTINNPTVAIGSGTTSSITTPATTFNLVDTIATTVNFAGAGTAVNIGKTTGSGTLTLHNDAIVIGTGATTTVSTPSTTVNLINTTATTVNFAGAGTAITIGATTGKTSIRNAELAVGTAGAASSITTPSTTFNLVNDTATTVNFANAATAINIGSALPGTTTIHHDLVVAGNITFNNGATQISSTVLSVDDPMLYLADNNVGDTVDIGFVGAYNYALSHPHTGLLRDASDGVWKLFSNAPEPVGNVLDFTSVTYDKLKIGDLTAAKGTFSGDLKVGNNFTVTASTGDLSAAKGTFTGDLSTTGDLSAVKGTFTGDLSAVKGTFSGKLTAAGADFSGTVTGITADMVGAYTKSETDSNIATVAAGLAAGNVTVSITSASGSSVDLATATGTLAVSHGGTGVTDSTGTGKVVLNDGPTLISPILGSATATSINGVTITPSLGGGSTLSLMGSSSVTAYGNLEMHGSFSPDTSIIRFNAGDYTVGYIDMPQVIKNSAAGPDLKDVGKHWFHSDSGTVTYSIDSSVDFPIGSVLTFINDSGAGAVTITVSGASLVLAGTGSVASSSVKLVADGIATAIKTTSSKWLINGVGVSAV